jgi:hypothetical protein
MRRLASEGNALFSRRSSRSALFSFNGTMPQGDDVVRKIKAEFDDAYGQNWHVIIGKHFGSKVTHDSKMFVFFYIEVSCLPSLMLNRLVDRYETYSHAFSGQGCINVQVWIDLLNYCMDLENDLVSRLQNFPHSVQRANSSVNSWRQSCYCTAHRRFSPQCA